jgi:hypothetical protein
MNEHSTEEQERYSKQVNEHEDEEDAVRYQVEVI